MGRLLARCPCTDELRPLDLHRVHDGSLGFVRLRYAAHQLVRPVVSHTQAATVATGVHARHPMPRSYSGFF
jgi:hypothetical protein